MKIFVSSSARAARPAGLRERRLRHLGLEGVGGVRSPEREDRHAGGSEERGARESKLKRHHPTGE